MTQLLTSSSLTNVYPVCFAMAAYFAVLSSVPGNIILTKDEFLFEAMKGTRHITKAIRFADSSSSPNLSTSSSAQGTTASRTLVKLDFGKVAGVKKLSGFGFGFEDLEIKLTDKQVGLWRSSILAQSLNRLSLVGIGPSLCQRIPP